MTHEPDSLDAQKAEEIPQAEANPNKERMVGLHEGQTWMSDDFNDPLPDSFWFGEEEETPDAKKERVMSLHLGQGWMRDDFDDPMTNEFTDGKL